MGIRIGTSGFSYDDWRGPFYPPDLPRTKMLGWYARVFDTVEINASFYRIPTPATFSRMVAQTPDGFEFAVKTHQSLTHTPRVDGSLVQLFRDAVRPLAESGRLACLLVQYPWSFAPSDENWRRVGQLPELFPDAALIVEFRRSEWDHPQTYQRLAELGLGFCCVDAPRGSGLMPPRVARTGSIGYLRLHGRNSEKWWDHRHAWERYQYRYDAGEMDELAHLATSLLASGDGATYAYFNNHYVGNATHNARELAERLGITLPEAPTSHPRQGELLLEF